MSFWKSIKQDVIASALNVNSSTTNLAKSPDSGYQFLGSAESTLGVAAIQVALKTDQNCTITVEQSTDNVPTSGAPHWDIVDTYNYYAGQTFGRTVQAISSYYRVTVTNLSTTTATSYFRLQAVLCPVVESIPRSLNSLGYMKNGGFLEDVAFGDVPFAIPWSKIGYTPTMNNTESDLWSGAGFYTPPSAAIQMRVISSSTSDTAAAGTGAQKVTIYYLDGNYNSASEEVSLNGTNGVNTTTTSIFRVNSFRVTTVGSGGKAAGNIQLQNTGGTVTYAHITAGYTRGRNSFYTVPLGKTLMITKVNISFGYTTGTTYARCYTRATYNDASGVVNTVGLFYPFHECIVSNTDFVSDLHLPTKLPATTDWKISGITPSGAGVATSVARGYLIG